MEINYEADGFPISGPVANGRGTLNTTWDDLLWAANHRRRRNRYIVFRHGKASLYEALFRASAVRMTVEQRTASSRAFRRTAAASSRPRKPR
jgi:hypothetical protein